MNLKMMNESFKRKYSNTLTESIDESDKEQLRKALVLRSMNVVANGGNIKQLEIALQEVIENFFPDKCWWEVTDCQIFNELFMNGVNPREICDMIVDQLKPEFAGNTEPAVEGLGEDLNNGNKNIVYSKNGVEVEYKSGNYFTVTKNGVAQKGFYVNDDGKDEEQIKQRARDKASMGDFKDDPGIDESLSEAALSGGMAGDNSYRGGTIRGRGASTQPGKNNYLNRLKSKNPDLVDTMVIKVSDIKPGMITQAGQVKEAEARNHPSGGKKMYIMHTNGYDGFWGLDETMDVMVDPENNSNPFAGDYRALLKMGLTESFREWMVTKLNEHLSRLNEAEMSDEDRKDSDLIRSMIAKLQKRSNSRFTPEEQAVMDKYGITRDNWSKELSVGGRSLHPSYDGKQRKVYGSYDDWRGHYVRNGDPSKINYADRARKLPQRSDDQIGGRWSPNGAVNAHTNKGFSTLQDTERAVQADQDREPVREMKRALWDRKYHQGQMDGAQASYDSAVGKARKKYDDEVRWATDQYRRDTVDASKSRDAAQARIDKMLKRQ